MPLRFTADPEKLESGLSENEVTLLRIQFGPNELAESVRFVWAREFIRLFLNPLILILFVASVISATVGQPIEAAIIIAMVILGILINFIQTYRSQNAVKSLRAKVAPRATVRRDGHTKEIPRHDLVPGDIIELSAGDMVPADASLLSARDLHVQEAALTGESLPVEKTPPQAGQISPVYLGTSIVSGTAVAVVTATGPRTKFGHIAERLMTPPPETEFDRGTRRFGVMILKTVFVLVIFVFLSNMMLHRDLLESLLFAVALAVGLTPEFLPVITAVTLGRGAVQMAKSKVIVKHLSAMQNFGSIDVLCSDKTGTITSGEMKVTQAINPAGVASDSVLELAYINSFFQSGIRSPLDQSVLKAKMIDLSAVKKLDEIPFDFERRRVSVVVERNGGTWLITKGAPESILPICSSLAEEQSRIDEPQRLRCQETFQTLHGKGLRVLAVASRQLKDFKGVFAKSDEQDMTLNGYVAFSDPILPGAVDAIKDLRSDGVDVKILTGDNELVAKYVCEQVGIDPGNLILGDQIDLLDDLALEHIAEQTRVFARVSPAQKTRIILALKSRKHVVGFMGDGINDAPSLHAADIGISFSSAVDVAQDASDIILLERNLTVLHEGITQGRMAFGNVMKYLLMGTSSNFGNMFSMAAASLFLPFLPMLPVQILLNNFLYDLAQISIPTDRVDETFTIKPRHWDISLIRNFMIFIGPLSSIFDFLTFVVLLKMFPSSERLFHSGWFVESLITQTLVIFSIRTAGNALRSRPSRALALTVLSVVLAGALIPSLPFAGDLGFVPLPLKFFAFVAIITAVYFILVEFVKRRLMKHLTTA